MLDRDGRNQVGLAVNIKRHRVTVFRPLGIQRDVSGNLCIKIEFLSGSAVLVGIPAAERIARIGGLGRFGNRIAVFDLFGFGSGGLAGVEIKCHRVLVDLPLCVQGDMVGDGSGKVKLAVVRAGLFFIPTAKRITILFRGRRRFCDWLAMLNGLRCWWILGIGVTVQVECHSTVCGLPFCIKVEVSSYRGAKVIFFLRVFGIPTNKLETRLFRVGAGLGDKMAVINILCINLVGGVGFKSDRATVFDARSECITIVLDGTPISCSIV